MDVIGANKKRDIDYANDMIVQQFLQEHLYSTSKCPNVIRYNDIEHQFAGIDLKWGNIYVDEKASTYTTNLQTFAHEIGQINRSGKWQKGWFNDDNCKADYYVYMFVDGMEKEGKVLKNISKAEIMVIKRSAIIEYLASIGWTMELLTEMENEIRKAYNTYGKEYWKHIKLSFNDIRFWLSDKLYEQPVNVLISRDKLRELSKKTVKVNE